MGIFTAGRRQNRSNTGKIMEENPELSYSFVKDMLLALGAHRFRTLEKIYQ